VLVLSEFFITTQKTAEIENAKDEIFTKYNLKSTIFQNKSMLKKYRNLHEKQSRFREYSSYILGLKLNSSERLTFIGLNDKTMKVTFSGIQKARQEYISKVLKSKKVKFKATLNDDILKMEIAL
jgi:hypothetical protein